MKKNKMLSLAAAMVLTSTAAMAFDTNSSAGEIMTLTDRTDVTTIKAAGYTDGFTATEDLNLSANQYGDALIYPAFQSANGWSTEITVRNTSSTNAMVAKVVVYGGKSTEELLDFNIYLSRNDVFKFDIKDNEVVTYDASVPVSATHASNGASKDSATFNKQDEKHTFQLYTDDEAKDFELLETEGYVVIYGMAMADDNGTNDATYHDDHLKMFKDYRVLVDECRNTRTDWRQAYPTMVNGMMTEVVTAPNVESNCSTTSTWTSPEANLVGAVRIVNSADKSRDVMLPATALANFTAADQMILWVDGEFASMADRRIDANGTYNNTNLIKDSGAFTSTVASLEFNKKKDSETKLLLTQPLKRTLVQLGDSQELYTGEDLVTKGIYEGNYGKFTATYTAYDLEEGSVNDPATDGPLTSPYTGGTVTTETYSNELAVIELDTMIAQAIENDFDAKEGYVDFNFTVPAIITQMNGGETTGDAQTNWTYTPSK